MPLEYGLPIQCGRRGAFVLRHDFCIPNHASTVRYKIFRYLLGLQSEKVAMVNDDYRIVRTRQPGVLEMAMAGFT